MAELDYTPSATAQRLSFGRTLAISVVTSYLTRPQAAERLRGQNKRSPALVEKHLGTRGTARNWNTVMKLAALTKTP